MRRWRTGEVGTEAGLAQAAVSPAEIAEAINYLASERAKATIGAALVVDAGYTVR